VLLGITNRGTIKAGKLADVIAVRAIPPSISLPARECQDDTSYKRP